MIGHYRLDALIGCGAQGEVYRAHDTRTGRDVALKLLHRADRRSAAEIRTCAMLDHPNIVQIYEAGEHEGSPYFTMKLHEANLAEEANLKRYSEDLAAAVTLVETIARAVHYLNHRGILHRDLKPANILLGYGDTPYVADFGVAKHVDDSDHGTIAGTRRYMAPEQLDGHNTVHCDVYSLGVILYELIAGRRPFESENTADLIREIRTSPPRDPRKHRPELHPDLWHICRRCLEKAPEDRYDSAGALADALRRHANGELPDGASRSQRALCWCVRHAAAAGLMTAIATFLLIMIPTAFSLIHAYGSTKRAQLLQANMNSAATVAGSVRFQLDALSRAVAFAAQEPDLARAIHSRDAAWQQWFCELFFDRIEDPEGGLKLSKDSPFDSWFILDAAGTLIAQSGMVNEVSIIGVDYEWRDYFGGAWALAENPRDDMVHVSSAFKSENDGHHKFALSTPIFDGEGQRIGVLVAAVATSENLGALVLDGTIAIAAPRDRERGEQAVDSQLLLLHKGYAYGEADPVASPQVEMLVRASQDESSHPRSSLVMSSDDYRDPAAAHHQEYAVRWLAGFAAVRGTGIVIIVQTPYDVLGIEAQFGGQLAMWTIMAIIPGVLLVLLATWHRRRRRPTWPGRR